MKPMVNAMQCSNAAIPAIAWVVRTYLYTSTGDCFFIFYFFSCNAPCTKAVLPMLMWIWSLDAEQPSLLSVVDIHNTQYGDGLHFHPSPAAWWPVFV